MCAGKLKRHVIRFSAIVTVLQWPGPGLPVLIKPGYRTKILNHLNRTQQNWSWGTMVINKEYQKSHPGRRKPRATGSKKYSEELKRKRSREKTEPRWEKNSTIGPRILFDF